MRNLKSRDEDDNYDYSPNELAELSINNRQKFEEIVNSNLEEGDSIHRWQQRNLERAKEFLNSQKHK